MGKQAHSDNGMRRALRKGSRTTQWLRMSMNRRNTYECVRPSAQ